MPKATPRKKALDTLQKLVRLAAADDNGYSHCWSCGNQFHWKEMDGGHFIPKGHSSYWALKVENVHPQCKPCNNRGSRFGTASQWYALSMVDYYGREFVDEMQLTKRNLCKIRKHEYLEMTAEWQDQIKHHLQRIGQ